MRALSLAVVVIVFAIAACSDVAAPIAAGSDAESLTGGGAAHFLGGHRFVIHGRHGDDHDDAPPECGEDDHHDHHDWTWRVHRRGWRGGFNHRWGNRGDHFLSHGNHGFSAHMLGSHDQDDADCGGGSGGEGGGGEPGLTATIGGAVTNDGVAASGFPVFLLDPPGTTVVASTTTTTDGTGSYSFTDVAPGPYLVCEADPFLEIYGFLGQTQPNSGPHCPAGYAPLGFNVEVAGGDTATGNNFVNLGLE